MTTSPYETLPRLPDCRIPVYVSAGVDSHARRLAEQFELAHTYLRTLFALPLDVCLALLSKQDWPRFTHIPSYGAAWYDYPQRTVVSGAEPTTFWMPVVTRLQTAAQICLNASTPYMPHLRERSISLHTPTSG